MDGQCPLVLRRRDVRLDTTAARCLIDGAEYRVCLGHWMFYVPGTCEKFFHAKGGLTDCVHPTRPSDEALQREWANETYSSADWRRALTTPLERRLAELWVVSTRLWRAGLGPRPLGVSFAGRFFRDGVHLGPTLGLVCESVDRLPIRREASDEDLLAAGVEPDRTRSSVRQQVRGYVIDLTSAVGVQPIDGEHEVQRTLRWIARAAREPRRARSA